MLEPEAPNRITLGANAGGRPTFTTYLGVHAICGGVWRTMATNLSICMPDAGWFGLLLYSVKIFLYSSDACLRRLPIPGSLLFMWRARRVGGLQGNACIIVVVRHPSLCFRRTPSFVADLRARCREEEASKQGGRVPYSLPTDVARQIGALHFRTSTKCT